MGVEYRKIEDTLALAHRIHGKVEDLPRVFTELKEVAGDAVSGPPIVIQHWPLSDETGRTMDVCIPLAHPIEGGDYEVITLEGGVAAITVHRGPYERISGAYQELIPAVYKHGHPIQENGREAFPNLDIEDPENTVVEIQCMIVGWEGKLEQNLERVLGKEMKGYVLSDFDELALDTEQSKRASIIVDAMKKLDEVATEDQKFEALSRCGHQFPAELIAEMRHLYRASKSIDVVIKAMQEGHSFFPKLRREGNIIYDRKGPARKEAYEKAETREEKMKAICFCPLLIDMWDKMPATFCYCSAGWPRRLFEGILETPVKVEVVKALTKGDDYCEFAIHLPDDVR